MEITEDSERARLLNSSDRESGRRRPIQLICLVIFAVGCIAVITAIVLLSLPHTKENIAGGSEGPGDEPGKTGGISKGWFYVLFLLADIVLGIICFGCLRLFVFSVW